MNRQAAELVKIAKSLLSNSEMERMASEESEWEEEFGPAGQVDFKSNELEASWDTILDIRTGRVRQFMVDRLVGLGFRSFDLKVHATFGEYVTWPLLRKGMSGKFRLDRHTIETQFKKSEEEDSRAFDSYYFKKGSTVAAELVKIAKSLMASVSEGDLCTVDMRVVQRMSGEKDFGTGNWVKVVRDTVRMGGGQVSVVEIIGDNAKVVAPGRSFMGAVSVPVSALQPVKMAAVVVKENPADYKIYKDITRRGEVSFQLYTRRSNKGIGPLSWSDMDEMFPKGWEKHTTLCDWRGQ